MLQSYKKQKLSIDVITTGFKTFWGKIEKYSLNLLSNSNMILYFLNGKQFQFVILEMKWLIYLHKYQPRVYQLLSFHKSEQNERKTLVLQLQSAEGCFLVRPPFWNN